MASVSDTSVLSKTDATQSGDSVRSDGSRLSLSMAATLRHRRLSNRTATRHLRLQPRPHRKGIVYAPLGYVVVSDKLDQLSGNALCVVARADARGGCLA